MDGGGVESHKLTLIFSTENLNLNGSLGGGVSASVTLATDGIGLARQSQLPAALSGGGNFKVDIQNQVSIGAVAQLPTSLAASGGLKVDDTSDNFGVAQYTVTTSGVQVAANQASEEVMFQAAKTNTGTVFVGNSTTQVIEVVPGAAISFPISNPNKFYYKGATAGDKLNVFWRF